ncbi:MAG TPA: hypothetical protein VGD45_29520 [Steroidobacter sp.]|uniref:hypothetical protein n=1 Tax=Steroidobacter sp. TaxID=1978227 RepID=UPI002ED819A0
MKPAATEAWLEVPFTLDSVTPAETPPGAEGVWHSYVISQGGNQITGMRAGTRVEVTQLVDAMIERLNERRIGKQKKGR